MGLLSSAHTLVDMVTSVMMSYNLKSKLKLRTLYCVSISINIGEIFCNYS